MCQKSDDKGGEKEMLRSMGVTRPVFTACRQEASCTIITVRSLVRYHGLQRRGRIQHPGNHPVLRVAPRSLIRKHGYGSKRDSDIRAFIRWALTFDNVYVPPGSRGAQKQGVGAGGERGGQGSHQYTQLLLLLQLLPSRMCRC